MNDKTEQSMEDTLRLAARNAALAGINGWGNLCSDAADTIDTLRAQLAAKAETAWIPVAVLPAPCLKVIGTYVNSLGNRRTIMAKWVPGKTEEAHSLDDEFGEYDEATDTTYAPEGWYEIIDNLDDCTFVAVSEGVITHWMPLPEAPDAIRAGAKA